MITMYVKTGCRFSKKVIDAVEDLGIEVEFKHKKDEGVIDELIARGGLQQFPYIVDGDVSMYGSDEIVSYLCENYSGDASQYPSVKECECVD